MREGARRGMVGLCRPGEGFGGGDRLMTGNGIGRGMDVGLLEIERAGKGHSLGGRVQGDTHGGVTDW